MIKKIPEHLRYRLLGDGGIFDRILNREVGMIWKKGDQDMAYELRGREQQEFIKKFMPTNDK